MLACFLLLPVLLLNISAEKCVTPNREEAECISLYSCPNLLSALGSQNPVSLQFVQQSNCGCTGGNPMVCCGPSSNFTRVEEKKQPGGKATDKMSLLPSKRYCGLQHADDYFRDEKYVGARITEFPWLAGIVHHGPEGDQRIVVCGGTLINRRYVLTAAHCLLDPFGPPVAVHLGEYDISLEKDCVQEPPFEKECSEPLQIFGIEKMILHPNYGFLSRINDIALIRLNRTARYNDYVRPICLPFPGTTTASVGDVLRSSGWGHIIFGEARVPIKKRILLNQITVEECKRLYQEGNKMKKVTEKHICTTTLSNSTDFGCYGDGGGPLIYFQRAQWHLEGIYSFGACYGRHVRYPDVYTKVANYLDWILENIEE